MKKKQIRYWTKAIKGGFGWNVGWMAGKPYLYRTVYRDILIGTAYIANSSHDDVPRFFNGLREAYKFLLDNDSIPVIEKWK